MTQKTRFIDFLVIWMWLVIWAVVFFGSLFIVAFLATVVHPLLWVGVIFALIAASVTWFEL